MTTCAADECDRTDPIAHGFCSLHYQRLRKKGDPGVYRKKLTDEEKLWSRVDKSGPCWEWTGPLSSSGYGAIRTTIGRVVNVHRLSYELTKAPIPFGFVIRHACHNKLCVKPGHLLIGTDLDNARDSVRARRQAYGERRGASKLTEDQAREIVRLSDSGVPREVIAERFGVHVNTVSSIRTGKTWGLVTGKSKAAAADPLRDTPRQTSK